MKAVYEFTASGTTTEGTRATFTGEVIGEVIGEDTDRFPPHAVAEAARTAVLELSPGFKFRGEQNPVIPGTICYPSLRKLKGKTKKLQAAGFTLNEVLVCLFLLLILCLMGAAIWALCHFIAKFW